ncbi:MAG: ATP-binding protein [Ignavibacteriales bacterium]|nr:ATP-binding protein [Ignavibacteriales bacterium]
MMLLKNYNRGYKGGLLIIGDRFSGKTTLSNIVADKFFANKKIYEINPTDSGSISIEDFEKQFSISLNQQGNSEAILNSTPNNTAIIINDLELWWERSNNGFAVVEKIVSLIENYSNKIFFIVNCNKHSLQFINRIYPIENIFISAIQTQPFDAEEKKKTQY